MIVRDKDGYDVGVECECGVLKKKRQNSLLTFANIPQAFADNRLSNFDLNVYKKQDAMADKMKVFQYYVDNFEEMQQQGRGLYLYSGAKGSGKTRMATSIANELLEKDVQVKFATSIDIINAIKSTWEDKRSPQAENETDLLKALQDADLLIIDDFGTEKVKDWQAERWYSIINTRYVNKKPTIFTSNMSLKDLSYDSRITSRIEEMAYQVVFPEESVRELISRKENKKLRSVI